jgi:hypothetical protein
MPANSPLSQDRAVARVAGLPAAILILPLSLCLPACVRTSVRGLGPLSPGASALSAHLSLDDRTYPLSACLSGDRSYFLGVDLIGGDSGPLLRVLIDPLEGPHLLFRRDATGGPEVLGRKECSELHVSVRPTGWRVNHVRDVEGEVAANCRLSDGGRLEARVTFAHCH